EISYADGKKRGWLFKEAVVDSETLGDDGYTITVTWTPAQKARFARL
ncbi:MAG: GTPase HflX, partial [Rhodobacteraceae bacterium]|nr:GTPase HflX [Paracoccaceae bacterium]